MKKNVVLFSMVLCLFFAYCGGGGSVQPMPQAYDMVILNTQSMQDDDTVLVLKVVKLAKPTTSSFGLCSSSSSSRLAHGKSYTL